MKRFIKWAAIVFGRLIGLALPACLALYPNGNLGDVLQGKSHLIDFDTWSCAKCLTRSISKEACTTSG
jgi:hypothetical protein